MSKHNIVLRNPDPEKCIVRYNGVGWSVFSLEYRCDLLVVGSMDKARRILAGGELPEVRVDTAVATATETE